MEILSIRLWIPGILILAGCGQSQDLKELQAAARELPEAIAAAKAAGVPLVAADLAPEQPVPDAENAAIDYRLATKELRAVERPPHPALDWLSTLEHLGQGRAGSEAELKVPRAFVRQAKNVFAHLDEAAQKAKCQFNVGSADALDFSELAKLKNLAKASYLRAVVAAHDHDAATVAKALSSMDSLVRNLADTPSLIAQLVGINFSQLELRSIEHVLVECRADPAIVQVCHEAVNQLPTTFDPANAFKGECIQVLMTIESLPGHGGVMPIGALKRLNDASGFRGGQGEAVDSKVVHAALKARCLQYYTQLIAALEGQSDTIARAEVERKVRSDWVSRPDLASRFASVRGGSFHQYCVAIRRYELRRLACAAGIEILRMHGLEFPTTVEPTVLGPNRAYSRTANGFRVTTISFDIPTEDPQLENMGFEYPRIKE